MVQERSATDMKVTLIKGPCLPGKCGVGDYTSRLAEVLQQVGARVTVLDSGDWGVMRLASLTRLVRATEPDILHLQYPTAGFGYKLGPQGLAAVVPSVVTIHEASKAHVLRKLSLYPFALRARHIIFTNDEERAFALRWAPWIGENSSVVPIGSNVPGVTGVDHREIREIVHFGLVMPRKGLEDVVELASLFKINHQELRVRVVGNCRPKDAAYGAEFRRISEGLPLSWEQELSEAMVGERLAGACIAYLPFPDGASERRATLKAALVNGMAVVTTRNSDTPVDLEPVVKFCSSPLEAFATIQELVANPKQAEELGNRARRYARRYSWDMIAQSHISIYRRLCRQTLGRTEQKVEDQRIA